MNTGSFTYEWANPVPQDHSAASSRSSSVSDPPRTLHRPLISRETEIFIPAQLTQSRGIVVLGLDKGDKWVHDEKRQTLFVVTQDMSPGAKHQVRVSIVPPPTPVFVVNSLWTDYGLHIYSFLALVLAFSLYFLALL
jgi:hypothetical protein